MLYALAMFYWGGVFGTAWWFLKYIAPRHERLPIYIEGIACLVLGLAWPAFWTWVVGGAARQVWRDRTAKQAGE